MRTRISPSSLLILALSLLTACVQGITIGGNVAGLTSTGLVLQNNGGDDLSITADGSFTFATPLVKEGGPYNVTVKTQPVGQSCTVTKGSGTAIAKVTDVNILCVANIAVAELHLLAGGLGGSGNIDGVGGAARFNHPTGVAVDKVGNVYVADSINNTIRKISPEGIVTTLAGTAGSVGGIDGTGAVARFDNPLDIAVDSLGNVYVADNYGHTIRKISPEGGVTTLAGTTGISGSTDGTGAAAKLYFPKGIALDSLGYAYISNGNTIRKISPTGVVTTLAGMAGTTNSCGSADGTGPAARFCSPSGIGLDSAGNAYVADAQNNTIRKISPDGAVTTLAGTAGSAGSSDGTGAAARFYGPVGLAVDSAGNVYVAEYYNSTIRKISPVGVVTTLAGKAGSKGSTDGVGTAARFNHPTGIAVDGEGNAYVADSDNATIRKISPAGVVTTLVGMATSYGIDDGAGEDARFRFPKGIAGDSAGNIYVADTSNYVIRKISYAGIVTTLAGSTDRFGNTDDIGAAASFCFPSGISLDSFGNVYVADSCTHTIRKISPAGAVTTVAGTAFGRGSSDGIGTAAKFNSPEGIALDRSGTIYVADTSNHTIRKITPAGVVTTLAGAAGVCSNIDGTGTNATFCNPTGIAIDSADNLYVTTYASGSIRKISPAGVVTTLAMTLDSGSGAVAFSFSYPTEDIAIDSDDNLYVADTGSNAIRKINPAGVVTTVLGRAGKLGVQLGALPASLGNGTVGVAVVDSRLLVISENSVLWIPKP